MSAVRSDQGEERGKKSAARWPGALAYQAGELGNVSSEDLVGLLDGSGIRTGIDPAALVRAGELVEDVLGRRLRSQVLRAGLVAR